MVQVYTEDIGSWGNVDVYSRRILVAGRVTSADWNLSLGEQVYLASTPGTFTFTRPTNAHVVLLGDATTDDTLRFDASGEIPYQWEVWEGSTFGFDGGDLIFEFGGEDESGVHNKLRAFDLSRTLWLDLSAGCTARKYAAMVWVAGYLYVFGGQDANGDALDTMCIYNYATDSWSGPISTPCGARIAPVLFPVFLDNGSVDIYVIGGYNDDGFITSTCRLQTGLTTHVQLSVILKGRGSLSVGSNREVLLEGSGSITGALSAFSAGPAIPDNPWTPPGSEEAFEQVACTEVPALFTSGKQLNVGTKLYLWDADDGAFVEFDTIAGTFTTYTITNMPSLSNPNVWAAEVYDGNVYLIIDDDDGYHAYKWEPGDTTISTLAAWTPDEFQYSYTWAVSGMCENRFILRGGLKTHPEIEAIVGPYLWYDCAGNVWTVQEAYEADPVAIWSDKSVAVEDEIWAIGMVLDPDDPGNNDFAAYQWQFPYGHTDWPGASELGITDGLSCYDDTEDRVYLLGGNNNVYYYYTPLGQWNALPGTIAFDTLTVATCTDRIHKIGDYLYMFLISYDGNWENPQLCVYRFDTGWTGESGASAYPVTRCYLSPDNSGYVLVQMPNGSWVYVSAISLIAGGTGGSAGTSGGSTALPPVNPPRTGQVTAKEKPHITCEFVQHKREGDILILILIIVMSDGTITRKIVGAA